MERLISTLLILTVIISPALSQQNNPGGPLGNTASNSWSGSFKGDVGGVMSVMNIKTSSNEASATIDADGYLYNLKGTLNGNAWAGTLTDPNTGGSMSFTASLNNGIIAMILKVPDEFGNVNDWPIEFRKSGNAASNATPTVKPDNNTGAEVSRDMNFVGGWRYTKAYTSNEFGMVSETYMNVYADGNYTYGDTQMAGGDADISFESGGNSGHATGKWKTENGVVYINEGYGWEAYAKYYIEGNSLLFTFSDDSKELWERYR